MTITTRGQSSLIIVAILLLATISTGCQAQPSITISPASFNFSCQEDNPAQLSETLHIVNSGSNILQWSASSTASWLTISPSHGNATGETDNVSLAVNTSGMKAGEYVALIIVLSPEAANSLQTAMVNLSVYSPDQQGNSVTDALNTEQLLKTGYNYPGQTITVEGTIVTSYYAQGYKGEPTFLNFHDPYQGHFTAIIWGEDRGSFPSHPESYYLNHKVRVAGKIQIYHGSPEMVLHDQEQIWFVE